MYYKLDLLLWAPLKTSPQMGGGHIACGLCCLHPEGAKHGQQGSFFVTEDYTKFSS